MSTTNKTTKSPIVTYLEMRGVEFDCEAENGWGHYWFSHDFESGDNKGYMTIEEAAAAACNHMGIANFVIKAEPQYHGLVILFGGERNACLKYMQTHPNTDLIYPNGQMSSYVLKAA